MEDGLNAIMFTKLAHKIFIRSRKSIQIEETQSLIDILTAKYENKSEKKWCLKDNKSFIVDRKIAIGCADLL